MVVHIVMIKLKDEHKSSKTLERMRREIEDLVSKVPSLKSMETGINFSDEGRAMDFVLISKFDDRAGLEEYAKDPEHLKVIEFIKSVASYSKVVDYEV